VEAQTQLVAGNRRVLLLHLEAKHLQPWCVAPCWLGDEEADQIIESGAGHTGCQAAVLYKEVVSLGVSRFDPEPLTAIEAAKGQAVTPDEEDTYIAIIAVFVVVAALIIATALVWRG
jgi:hypothetical protein